MWMLVHAMAQELVGSQAAGGADASLWLVALPVHRATVSVMIFICYFTAWFVAARKLRSLVDNGFGIVQACLVLGLTVVALVQCVARLTSRLAILRSLVRAGTIGPSRKCTCTSCRSIERILSGMRRWLFPGMDGKE